MVDQSQADVPQRYATPSDLSDSTSSFNSEKAINDGLASQQFLDITAEQRPSYEKYEANSFAKQEANLLQFENAQQAPQHEQQQVADKYPEDVKEEQAAIQQTSSNGYEQFQKGIEQKQEAYISPNNDLSGATQQVDREKQINKKFQQNVDMTKNDYRMNNNQLDSYMDSRQSYFMMPSDMNIDYGAASYPSEDATMKKSAFPQQDAALNPTPKVSVVVSGDRRQMMPPNATHPRKFIFAFFFSF